MTFCRLTGAVPCGAARYSRSWPRPRRAQTAPDEISRHRAGRLRRRAAWRDRHGHERRTPELTRNAVTDERGRLRRHEPAGRHVHRERRSCRDSGRRRRPASSSVRTAALTADFAMAVGAHDRDGRGRGGHAARPSTGRPARSRASSTARRCATLALSGRNYLELASLIPGAVQIDDDQMAVTTAWAPAARSSTATAATATT